MSQPDQGMKKQCIATASIGFIAMAITSCGSKEESRIRKLEKELEEKTTMLHLVFKADAYLASLNKSKANTRFCKDKQDDPIYRNSFVCTQGIYADTSARRYGMQPNEAAVWSAVAALNDTYRASRVRKEGASDARFESLASALGDQDFRKNADPIKVMQLIRKSPTLTESYYLKTIADTQADLKTEISRSGTLSKAVSTNKTPIIEDNSMVDSQRRKYGVTDKIREEYCETGALPLSIPYTSEIGIANLWAARHRTKIQDIWAAA